MSFKISNSGLIALSPSLSLDFHFLGKKTSSVSTGFETWASRQACYHETDNVIGMFSTLKQLRDLQKARIRYEDSIRMDLKEIDSSMRIWMNSPQSRDCWTALENAALNLMDSINCEDNTLIRMFLCLLCKINIIIQFSQFPVFMLIAFFSVFLPSLICKICYNFFHL